MSMPTQFADLNPVSLSYSPLVPVVSEATRVPIPVTEQAANEIDASNPLGKIVSVATDYARKAAASPDFNALMGVLAQYLINTTAQQPAPQPEQKSWFKRFHEYWTTTPAQKAAAEQQQKSAFQRRQFLSAAAPFVGRIANAYVPGSGDLVTSGLLALGRKLGFGRRRRRRGGNFNVGEKRKVIFVEDRNTGETRILGTKADFEKDVKEVAREAFIITLEKDHGKERTRKFVKEVFDKKGSKDSWISKIADIFAYVVKIIKPDWYVAAKAASTLATSGYDIYRNMKTKREAEMKEERREALEDLKNHLKRN